MSDNIPPLWANAMQERLLAAMSALRADVAALITDMTAMRTEAATLRTDMATLRTETAALRIDMATRTNIADIMARIDRLQEDLTRQRENSVVELGTSEMALRKNENTRKDVETLTEMVLALTRQVRRID